LWGKTLAGVLFGLGITTLATVVGALAVGLSVTNPAALAAGLALSAMAYSAMGILFASIPTGSPGEVVIPLNLVRIPLMFVSGMFIPLEGMPTIGVYAAFLSPLTHTLDLLRLGLGGSSNFGWAANVGVLAAWMIVFLFMGQMFHKIIMKRE
ncbi:ABC transporter permease, partial [Candidatus Bathyarchaeota archaeon]